MWACSHCGGVIGLHTHVCSTCEKELEPAVKKL
jgi:hypothetical protein